MLLNVLVMGETDQKLSLQPSTDKLNLVFSGINHFKAEFLVQFLPHMSFWRTMGWLRIELMSTLISLLPNYRQVFFFKVWESNSFCKCLKLSGTWRVTMNCPSKGLIDGEEKSFREGKVQFCTSLSCLKEMWVGSAGEAWRLMLQKGALTASPLVAVLLGGPIGLGCHFCYLILCMWTRQIQRVWGVGVAKENARISLL